MRSPITITRNSREVGGPFKPGRTVHHLSKHIRLFKVHCLYTIYAIILVVLQLWYAHRPPEDEHYRARAYSSSDVHDSILPESMKLHVGVNSNGDVDVGEINLSEMDPEDIRVSVDGCVYHCVLVILI